MCTVPTFKCSCYYVCVYVYRFVPYHGMVALACGYVVAVKQFHPDSVAFPPPAPPTLRVKVEKYLSETDHIPSLSLSHTHTLTHTLTCIHLHNCTHTHTHTHTHTQHLSLVIITIMFIFAILQLVTYAFCWLAISGTVTAWIYLRFYQKRDQGLRGDMSEGFAFATFFPEMIQPPLATLGGFVYHTLVSIKVCPKTVRTYDVGAPSTIKLTLPGTDPVDAQRRK